MQKNWEKTMKNVERKNNGKKLRKKQCEKIGNKTMKNVERKNYGKN